jgi:hypothetical protein
MMRGEYFCEYLNKATYARPVHEEVEEVYVEDFKRAMRITRETKKLEDVFKGISFSVGGPSISLGSILDLGAALKGKVTKTFELNVIERRERRIVSEICIDAISGEEKEDIFEMIKRDKPTKKEIKPRAQIKEGKVLSPQIKKADAINKLKAHVMRKPDEAERILKETFGVEFLELVYVPEYHLVLESEKERKNAVVCGVRGKAELL